MLRIRRSILVAVAVVGFGLPLGHAELDNGVFTSEAWRIQMVAPSNWQPTEQTAYPNVLLWMERRDPKGIILLTAERIETEIDSTGYAKATLPKLEKMGFRTRPPQLHTTTGASLVDFESDTSFLRQAFLVVDGVGYSLTLAAESSRLRGLHLRAFDSALRSIKPIRDIKAAPAGEAP